MTFKTATVTQRMAVRDTAFKLGRKAQLLTVGSGPLDSKFGDEIDALAVAAQSAIAGAGYAAALPSGTAPVKQGDAVTVASGGKTVPASAAVSGNTLGNINLTNATDTVASDGDAVSIQDRNGNTLKGNAVSARVASGKLVSAFFSALTDALNSDGNPLDITTARGGSTVTGRVRVYVTNNIVRNVYLDGAAALITGATVPVQNSIGQNIQPGTVTVTNNLVASVKLPANYTAFGDGIAHKVTDAAGVTAQATAKVASGSLTDQILTSDVALVKNGTSPNVTLANGATSAVNAVVSAGVLKLNMPGVQAIVGDGYVVGPKGSDTNSYTISVTNGVISGIKVN